MKKLLKNANLLSDEICKIIGDVVTSCDTCARLKKPWPRPTVSLPKSSEFNVVSVSLYYIKLGLFYLHIIDEFIKYSQAAIIKHKNESIKAFLTS